MRTTRQDPASAPVAMVSGATRGIGLAIARELLAHGWRVSAGCRTLPHAGVDAQAEQWLACPFDAARPETETAWVQATRSHFGRIDAIVHNAGVLSRQSVLQASSEDFDALFEVNVKSPMRLTQLVWADLLAAPQGKVLIMASLAGKRVRSADASLYAMSKFAVLALAHGLRHCGAGTRVRATAICPGFVATDMASGVDADLHAQLTQPEDVARLARVALELPPTASVAEIPVSWSIESQF
ncbi:NADP-dependent 3-hydroxy acid dehydrogenase YdfG [Comamonas sp. BIGb0124]|uniref:SDR family NAD(P)-dependent oxidoreductase n=1 Tax=Comamonas sp. BIGb0124 TaxID=2485130 RepID=UPI000FB6DA5A|nr:SDR family NAD(P)-dependent oxidoreductase [Comamonas sp. BIGb0124]ROR24849.1 NADP-dependent 3-hydroxy acid dehydrogenase YdfG [Comamonas sp. BIGb0124]